MFLFELFENDSGDHDLSKFKSWFSGSKIVNADNTPKVMYHGTSADIRNFDPTKIGSLFNDDKHGFYFTGSPDTAEQYAMHAANKLGGHANIMPVYLSIKNPYTFKDYAYNYYYDKESENLADDITDGRLLIDWFDKNKEGIMQIAMEEGRDGIFFVRGSESLAVAFRPEQIMSAITSTAISEEFLGTCVNSFDEDGECIVGDLPYRDVSDFAYHEGESEEISSDEFHQNVIVPNAIKSNLSDQLMYLHDDENDVYMIYDDVSDVHYFFNAR